MSYQDNFPGTFDSNYICEHHVIWLPVTTAWRVPGVSDGADGIQMWMVAANVLNNQSPTAEKV